MSAAIATDGGPARPPEVVILDVDGTLVDSVYAHVTAWADAFAEIGVTAPHWTLHRHIGMGSDRFVAAVAGPDVERRHGDRVRALHGTLFRRALERVVPLPGASDAVRRMARAGIAVAVASSAPREELGRHLESLAVSDCIVGAVCADDVPASKPAPDLFRAAQRLAGEGTALVVGDATWDVRAARAAGIPAAAVLTGGFGAGELAAAGAVRVLTDLAAVVEWFLAGAQPDTAATVELVALGQLQGEAAADPTLVADEERFAAAVRGIVARSASADADRARLQARLQAMRGALAEAGS